MIYLKNRFNNILIYISSSGYIYSTLQLEAGSYTRFKLLKNSLKNTPINIQIVIKPILPTPKRI